jgi:hypothetical protein
MGCMAMQPIFLWHDAIGSLAGRTKGVRLMKFGSAVASGAPRHCARHRARAALVVGGPQILVDMMARGGRVLKRILG